MSASVLCPACFGRGSVLDPDPMADRRQWITCRACGGTRYKRVSQESPESETAPSGVPRGVRLIGKCRSTGKFFAAIIPRPLTAPDRAAVYRQLVSDARQQISLAKRWDVWGVLASDEWAAGHRNQPVAP